MKIWFSKDVPRQQVLVQKASFPTVLGPQAKIGVQEGPLRDKQWNSKTEPIGQSWTNQTVPSPRV